jgi:hypothetical protein
MEKSRGVPCAVCIGKVSMAWLSTIVEVLVQGIRLKDFVQSLRVGRKEFIAQARLVFGVSGIWG